MVDKSISTVSAGEVDDGRDRDLSQASYCNEGFQPNESLNHSEDEVPVLLEKSKESSPTDAPSDQVVDKCPAPKTRDCVQVETDNNNEKTAALVSKIIDVLDVNHGLKTSKDVEKGVESSQEPEGASVPPRPDLSTRLLQRIPHVGLLLAVLSSFTLCVCSVIVKQVSSVDPSFLASFRFLGVLIPSIIMVVYNRQWPFPKTRMLTLVIRSICGTVSLVLKFYAVRLMPLADASVIIFSSPAVVMLFARVFLKEACSIFRVLMVMFTLSGIVLITRPPFIFQELGSTDINNMWGAAAAIGSVFFAAAVYIFLRNLRDLDSSIVLLNYGIIGLIGTLIVSFSVSTPSLPKCTWEQMSLVLMGVLSFVGQYCLTKALQFEEAGPVSVARSSDVVFAFVWQVAAFGDIPHPLSIVGAILVSFSVIFIVLAKHAEKKPSFLVWVKSCCGCKAKQSSSKSQSDNSTEPENNLTFK